MSGFRRNSPPVPLSFEQLECRVALAGDVSAALSAAGDLTLKGDRFENFVLVFIRPGNGGSPDQLVVQGDTSPSGAATTVGGQAEKAFDMPVAGLHSISANFGKALTGPNDTRGALGTDAILATGLTLSGDLSIKGQGAGGVVLLGLDVRGKTTLSFSGAGLLASGTATALEIGSAFIIANSRLGLGPAAAPDSTPHKDVIISDGARGGFIYAGGVTAGRDLNIVTKSGLDQVIVGKEIDFTGLADALGFPISQTAVTTPTLVQGNLKIDTGSSDDFITVVKVEVRGGTTVKSGPANDDVIIGDTHNTGKITTLHGPTTIDMGSGDPATAPFGDWLVMAGSLTNSQTAAATTTCDASLTLTSKSGNDSFGLFGAGVKGNLSLTSGAGHDHVDAINFAVLGAASFKTGDGDDTVLLDIFSTFAGSSVIGQALSIDAGKGFDYVAIDHVQFAVAITLKAGADNDTVVFKGGVSIPAGLAHTLDGGAGIHDELDETVFGGSADSNFEDFGIALAPFYDEIFAEVENDFGNVLDDMGITWPPV